jgi:3-dehydroquinate dehydratase-2
VQLQKRVVHAEGSASKVGTCKNILVINGPNLNLLGDREPHTYGTTTLSQIEERLMEMARAAGATLFTFQSNSESELVERIQRVAREPVDFIIINPAAYTHTSIAMRDALTGVGVPFVEVHLSNIAAREPFRHHSHLSGLAVGTVSGLGAQGYELALAFALQHPSRR